MALDPATLALRYAVFAAAATGVNVATQYGSLAVYDGVSALPIAMLLGTGTGLVAKYVLDKRWIFFDKSTSLRDHSIKLTLYSIMGVGTTAVFWATELLFDALSADERMRYLGAVVGLAIGYFMKYRLDRRFVFQRLLS